MSKIHKGRIGWVCGAYNSPQTWTYTISYPKIPCSKKFSSWLKAHSWQVKSFSYAFKFQCWNNDHLNYFLEQSTYPENLKTHDAISSSTLWRLVKCQFSSQQNSSIPFFLNKQCTKTNACEVACRTQSQQLHSFKL